MASLKITILKDTCIDEEMGPPTQMIGKISPGVCSPVRCLSLFYFQRVQIGLPITFENVVHNTEIGSRVSPKLRLNKTLHGIPSVYFMEFRNKALFVTF